MTEEEFISGYEKLIGDIQAASPDTKIICCSVSPVADGYAGHDGLSSDKTDLATTWVKQVCRDTGVYYADTASAVRSGRDLMPKYAAANNKAINAAGLAEVITYLRTHALS